MTGRDHVLARRRWRAPQANGAALIDPPLSAAVEQLLQPCRMGLATCPGPCVRQDGTGLESHPTLLGRPLTELARQARSELLPLARAYTSAYRDLPAAPSGGDDSPLVLAGHQPHLFHAGVWFKNFVLSELAAQSQGQAVNLLIDNDVLRGATIRVPGGSPDEPHIEQVPFDGLGGEIPYEEREILDPACFDSFDTRATRSIAPIVPWPLVGELWELARRAARRSRNLGRVLAEARHSLEAFIGLSTLEVPLSLVCETESFRWFTVGLLAELPRFHDIYNSSLAEYRHANKIRSRSHPVPDLAEEDGYLEAPFWLWTREDPRRRRLFVRQIAGRLEISDRDRLQVDLTTVGEEAVDVLRSHSALGLRLRPRALTTTMFARLLLSDLFVHGLGGGKYDELTDAILARHFGITPPAFMVATATLRLSGDRPRETPADLARLRQVERELRFHPEKFLVGTSEEVRKLSASKQAWLAKDLPRGKRRERHLDIERVNLALQPYLEGQRLELAQSRERMAARLRAASLLGSREFAFCLFRKEELVAALKALTK